MNLRDEMMRIRDERGELTPENVVADAREESSPLHHRFEWDDAKAAESYRIVQARELIRKVKIAYTDAAETTHSIRAFLPVRGESSPASSYEPTEVVMADPVVSAVLLREFDREWRSFKTKYSALKEFRDALRIELEEVA